MARPLLHRWLWAGLVGVAACGSHSSTPGTQKPCTKQTDCSSDYSSACESQFCSETLPKTQLYPLNLSLSAGVKGQGPQSLRIAVVDATTPAGLAAHCAQLTSLAQLTDPAAFNLTAPVLSVAVSSVGDSLQTLLQLDSPSRVVYTEVYAVRVSQLSDPTNKPIGTGCSELPADALVTCNPQDSSAPCTRVTVSVTPPKP
jgi:hypothetical protein